jgi:DNA-binding NarL/FixJ family response regulator
MRIRCLIIDDNEAFLASAARLLKSANFDVVGTASSAADAIRVASEVKPDLAIIDVELGG